MSSSPPPLVSVVMPVLNPHSTYFSQAIESVLAQTLTNWEMIIVEDPGISTAEPLLPRAEERIQYIRNPTRTSFAGQINQGLNAARGEFIARFDADDICEPDRLEKQVALLREQADVGVVGCQLAIIDTQDKAIGFRAYPQDHTAIVDALKRYSALAHPGVMFRRAVWQRAGGYQPGDFPGTEDYDLWCRWATQNVRFANHPEALVRYRIHPGAMKAERLRDLLRGTLEIKRTYWRGKMRIADRLRMFAERLLVWLPASVVLWLFVRTQFVGTLPQPASAGMNRPVST